LITHYTNRRDAELAHPALDLSAAMRKSDFDRIGDSYGYPEVDWVKCQLEIDGNTCGQDHGTGWFMVRKDGVEGYIGGDCAQLHFGKDKALASAFATAVASARRDIRTQGLIERLGNLIKNRDALQQRIGSAFELQQQLRKRIAAVRQLFPYPVLSRLNRMTKFGDRKVHADFGYLEKDEDRNQNVIQVTRWKSEVIATVAAPHAIEMPPIELIGTRIGSALAACRQAEASPERSDKELRGWAESLEAVDRCHTELEVATLALDSFITPTNLRGLCWLCPKDEDQIMAASAGLRLAGVKEAGDRAARRARDAWRNDLIASRNGAQFKVVP
jgi:hypothetical protein